MHLLIGLLGLMVGGLVIRWLRPNKSLPSVIPGNWPLLGHLPAITQGGLFRFIHQQCSANRRIFTLKLGAVPMVIINDVATARELLTRKFQTFHDRPLPPVGVPPPLKNGLIFAQGVTWKRQREACNPMFAASSTNYARGFSQEIQSCLQTFVAELSTEAKAAPRGLDIYRFILKSRQVLSRKPISPYRLQSIHCSPWNCLRFHLNW